MADTQLELIPDDDVVTKARLEIQDWPTWKQVAMASLFGLSVMAINPTPEPPVSVPAPPSRPS
jgi:hypothetical protein